ncbi:MAG TPA: TIGR00159 family protein [Algoriphagus sp.]|uniref:diadenylate cyclase CdaA n=1 Tax=unclassified Algoriphagus TaxID=2641541 RepID=UPI000C5CB0F6|nr:MULTISPECIES: diadenylate cyclase CdaA [unclassified Algoriphagus]MAL15381.1 TIGR00159 family protein [Algoriphagus sp.]QYH38268.1 TIGR00159 family protein [Algoriphagus sp. NBT04N3]HAD52956.1 TIGR00159 family protein [Algoriphagus sp.]HAS60737.1 TIGR00159 family protein [Algoriphagus sp.]HCD86312.1 TIGR00159 family protein [Algoriphagus sp.]
MTLLFKIGFLEISIVNMVDIALVSFLLYQVYKLLKGSVAIKIFLGFLSIYLVYLLVRALRMELLSSILGQFMGVGVIAAIIIFAPEIRKFLLLIGRSSLLSDDNVWKDILFFWRKKDNSSFNISPIIDASKTLAGSNTGALMVISKSTELKFYAESGDILDAELSKRLLVSIFNKYSPLHDGAVIIHNGKIKAARCILPVTEREVPAQFGLRHRAGIGMSEATDAVILIVSEETGQISMAKNGKVLHNMSFQEVRETLNDYLNSLDVDSRFENLEDYEMKKKRKLAMTSKS